MKAAELFVKCLENEGVEYIFGIPGEENIDVMDALLTSKIKFVTVRHEQGAAFMADVYGRLTGRPGVCLATLGPGATNLVTGFADANMDYAPIVAIAGQGSTERLHKESHQIIDLVNLFKPISKYSTEILSPNVIPEVISKAFKVAVSNNPGGAFISFPENIASSQVAQTKQPLEVPLPIVPEPSAEQVQSAISTISDAKFPMILVGNGVVRSKADQQLIQFAERLNIPVVTTFMAKGSIPSSHELSLGTVGLQADDYIACGFERADVIICVGFDMIEYHPKLWHKSKNKRLIHIAQTHAEVDEHYIAQCNVVGNIKHSLALISQQATPQTSFLANNLRDSIRNEIDAFKNDDNFPLKPQKILNDVRHALANEDILISDVGAHKMWIARLYQAESPNSCIISNGFASMGIGVPGAIAAKLVNPDKTVLTITGDAGFMMNSQEIETALRLNTPLIIMIWNDSEYGLIKWHQLRHFGRESNISFNNPDFVKYAESFGAKGYRVESAQDLAPTIEQAIKDNTVVVIDVPIDYSENMKLTEKLGQLVCPM